MHIIRHRVDSLKKLENLDKNAGIEIDIRTEKGKIVAGHNPFRKIFFTKSFLNKIKNKFIIFDIKEEGIENKVYSFIKKNRINKYFLINVTMPRILQLLKKKINLSLRLSSFESLNKLNFFFGKISWVWIDTFNNEIPLSKKSLKKMSKKFKLCLVSPELVPGNKIKINTFIERNREKINFFSCICSKKFNIWKNYL